MSARLRSKFAVSLTTGFLATGTAPTVLRAAAALDRLDRAAGILHAAGGDIVESLARLIDQQQVNAFALQTVVMVQPLRIDQRHVAFAVLGDDFLGAGLDFFSQLRKVGAGLRQRNNVVRGNSHCRPPGAKERWRIKRAESCT